MRRKIDKFTPFGAVISLVVLVFLTASWPAAEVRAGDTPSDEYQIKAACLLNFAQFIEWPAAAFPAPETPITVGVLGDDPFGSILEQTFQDESVQGRKLVVKRSRQIDDLKMCHLLFISNSEKDRLAEILASLKGASIVTVGETDQFAQRGGIINFYMNNNKVRFEINPDVAEQKGLKINSQLLKRAKIVSSDQEKGKQ
jgi:hypothetical protein